jgi:hypothetical protein
MDGYGRIQGQAGRPGIEGEDPSIWGRYACDTTGPEGPDNTSEGTRLGISIIGLSWPSVSALDLKRLITECFTSAVRIVYSSSRLAAVVSATFTIHFVL